MYYKFYDDDDDDDDDDNDGLSVCDTLFTVTALVYLTLDVAKFYFQQTKLHCSFSVSLHMILSCFI